MQWNAAQEIDLTIEVPHTNLTHHLDNFRPLQRLTGGLVSTDKLKIINRATELLESRISGGEVEFGYPGAPLPRTTSFNAFNAAYCPMPNIVVFTNLLDLAWGAINHEAAAIPRFKDAINTVIYRKNVRKPEQVSAVSKRWAEQSSNDHEGISQVIESKRAALPSASTDTLIEMERVMPVIVAAVIVAGNDTTVQNRYLSFLLGQVKGLNQLDAVYREARNFLRSNPGEGFFDLLVNVAGTCGSDDGPIFYPPYPEDLGDMHEIEWLVKLHCSDEMVIATRRGIGNGGTYRIDGVNWGGGCPGNPVVINGTNFGGGAERNCVNFTHWAGETHEMIHVYPATDEDWTDTRIEVTLPEEAGPGPVNLSIMDGFASACGMTIEIPRRGNSVNYTGGTAYIRNFFANSRRGDLKFSAGETITLTWVVVPFYANVHLRVVIDNTIEVDSNSDSNGNPWPTEGSYTFTTPDDHDSEITCTLTADAACPGEDSRTINILSGIDAELSVHGIEVTQAIQHYRATEHITAVTLNGREINQQLNDNSLQLVADKPAWVRVYMRSGLPVDYNNGQLRNISGTLVVERQVSRIWSPVDALASVNAPFIAEASFPDHDSERSDIDTTLNFILPAATMSGRLRLTVMASSSDEFTGEAATDSITLDVNLQQQLQVAALRIGYDGPNAAGTANVQFDPPPLHQPPPPAPVVNTIAEDCEALLNMLPVSSALTLRSLGTEDATTPLITPPPAGSGDCDPDWTPIIDLVADARIADEDQTSWIYFGFVTDDIPVSIPHGNSGCNIGINSAGIVGSSRTFVHETGHQMGMGHAPCGRVGRVEERYPLYEPYDTGTTTTIVTAAGDSITEWHDASIGGYGLDINNGDIFNPDPSKINARKDFMSYCGRNRWVSIFSHTFMANNASLNPTSLPTGFSEGYMGNSPGMGDFEESDTNARCPRITITGHIDANEKVAVKNVARMKIRYPRIDGTATDYLAELIDEDESVASTAPLFALSQSWNNENSKVCGNADQSSNKAVQPPFSFIAVLADTAEGKSIRIRRHKETVWLIDRPAEKPELGKVSAELGKDQRLKISWTYHVKSENRIKVWLQWSNDQGNSWNALSVGIRKDFAEINIDDLPAGQLIFRVLSHDGFYTISKTSPPVTLPDRAPLISIIHPRVDSPVHTNIPLRLLGALTIRSRNILKDEEFVWRIDEKEVGRGLDSWVKNPGKGQHKIEFEVRDPAGHASVCTLIEFI